MSTQTFDVKVAANGRMVLPASVRAALGIMGETRVTLTLDNGSVSVLPMMQHVLHAQDLYRRHITTGQSVDDFLKDRRVDDRTRQAKLTDAADR